jgi:hypothetical protein
LNIWIWCDVVVVVCWIAGQPAVDSIDSREWWREWGEEWVKRKNHYTIWMNIIYCDVDDDRAIMEKRDINQFFWWTLFQIQFECLNNNTTIQSILHNFLNEWIINFFKIIFIRSKSSLKNNCVVIITLKILQNSF